ncbi:hypothetical protein R3W88_008048 [Solanum pinnatisectum]|uniref:Maturase K n=1 Tax=Solanum pinnatisectum TaxID=50273 RepID=A0AAV9M8S0_9SOLN|nr:hypothetical protein R3W88_008048 [Solanum pinnatisectum]
MSTLPNMINFGVDSVVNKNWFFKIWFERQVIDDSVLYKLTNYSLFLSQHIDVIFYYIRKKTKYSNSSTFKFTNLCCNFNTVIQSV